MEIPVDRLIRMRALELSQEECARLEAEMQSQVDKGLLLPDGITEWSPSDLEFGRLSAGS